MSNDVQTHTPDSYEMPEQARELPRMVVLSLNYVCNAECPNCPYNNSDIRSKYKKDLYMSREVFTRIADQCGPFGSYLRFSAGGEPMLHPEIVEFARYGKAKGAQVGIISNGSRYTRENLEALISLGVDALEFSVDAGDAQTYAFARPGLDWELLNRNVRLAREIRDAMNAPTRLIASVINQKGVDVEAAVAHWTPVVDKVQVRKYLTWGYSQDNSADTTPYLPPDERLPCPFPFERLFIDTRGDVTLCVEDIAFDKRFANVLETPLKDIWQGPELTRLRELHLARTGDQEPLCAQCPDWRYRSWKYNYWKILEDAHEKG